MTALVLGDVNKAKPIPERERVPIILNILLSCGRNENKASAAAQKPIPADDII